MKLTLILAGALSAIALSSCTTITVVPEGSPTSWNHGSGFYQGITPQAKVELSFKYFVNQGDQGLGDQGVEHVVVQVTNTSSAPILVSSENFFAEVVPGYMGKPPEELLPQNASSVVAYLAPPTKFVALDAEKLIEQARQAVQNSDTSYALTSTMNLATTIISVPGAASGNKHDRHTLDEVNDNQTNSEI